MPRLLPLLLVLHWALPCFGQGAAVAPVGSITAWRATLAGKDDPAKERALEEIRKLGPAAKPLLHDLIKLFDTMWALDAVEVVGNIGKPAVGPLTACLTDPSDDQRAMAAIALGRIGPPAASTIPKLQALTRDKGWGVRAVAIEALGKIVRTPGHLKTTLPILVDALNDSEPAHVIQAHRALGRLGLLGQRQRRAWERRALDKTRPVEVRSLAAALAARTGRHADPVVHEGLVDGLRTPGLMRSLRREVFRTLETLEAKARWAIPYLLDALRGRDPIVRGHAVLVLRKIAPGSRLEPDVAKALAAALEDRASNVRSKAAAAWASFLHRVTPAVEGRLLWLAKNSIFSAEKDRAKRTLKALETARKGKRSR